MVYGGYLTGAEDAWRDLRERLGLASAQIERLKNKAAALHNTTEYSRLDGKLDGIKVALSYMDEWERVHA